MKFHTVQSKSAGLYPNTLAKKQNSPCNVAMMFSLFRNPCCSPEINCQKDEKETKKSRQSGGMVNKLYLYLHKEHNNKLFPSL